MNTAIQHFSFLGPFPAPFKSITSGDVAVLLFKDVNGDKGIRHAMNLFWNAKHLKLNISRPESDYGPAYSRNYVQGTSPMGDWCPDAGNFTKMTHLFGPFNWVQSPEDFVAPPESVLPPAWRAGYTNQLWYRFSDDANPTGDDSEYLGLTGKPPEEETIDKSKRGAYLNLNGFVANYPIEYSSEQLVDRPYGTATSFGQIVFVRDAGDGGRYGVTFTFDVMEGEGGLGLWFRLKRDNDAANYTDTLITLPDFFETDENSGLWDFWGEFPGMNHFAIDFEWWTYPA